MRATLWLWAVLGLAAGAGVGLAAVTVTTPVYQSTTSVLVESGWARPGAGGEWVGPAVNIGTEAELVRSSRVATDATAALGGHPDGRLADARPVAGSAILVIVYEAASATAARDGAAAWAAAYLAARGEAAQTALSEQIEAVRGQLDDVQTQLVQIDAQLAQVDPDSSPAAQLRATATSLAAQSTALATQLTTLQTTTVNPGRVVVPAELPTVPARPNRAWWLSVGAGLGGVTGAGLHLVRSRWSGRIRRDADLRRHRVPLLAQLGPAALRPGVRPGPIGRTGYQDPNAAAFNRLRNEVAAALTVEDHVLLVTGVGPGQASTIVAASLAAAFARAERDVALVGASTPELRPDQPPGVTLAGIFDLADIPGLSDVLAGRTTLARAVQRAPRAPHLKVVTPGGTASAAGLLQSEGARAVLRQIAEHTRYVIIDAPSMAAGADAQSLAAAADVALLVIHARQARHAQVADAMTQLSRVGTRLLGVVLVPPSDEFAPSQPPTPPNPSHPSHPHPGRPVRVGPGDDAEGWVTDRTAVLDGPTRKLDVINRPPAAAQPRRDLGVGNAS